MATPRKYLDLFGNPIRSTSTIKTYVNKYEQMPFDGVLFNPVFTHQQISVAQPFSVWNWSGYRIDWASLATSLSDYNTTEFRRFSQNYVLAKVSVLSGYPLADWMSPDILSVVWNFRMAAAFAAKAPLCRGIFFDPENDNTATLKIWQHSDRPFAETNTFVDYKERAYEIGYWIMQACQEEKADIRFVLSFGYEQATKDHDPPIASDRYGLYARFLDGLYDACKSPAQIINYYEDGYAHYLQADIDYDIEQQLNPPSSVQLSKRFWGRHRKGFATRTESIADDANCTTSVVKGNEEVAETVSFMYNESAAPFLGATGTPTVGASRIAAIHTARVELGFEYPFDPYKVKGLILDFNPAEILLAQAADSAITSYTDRCGNVYTQTGSARPLIKTDGIATGVAAALFATASSQYLSIANFITRLVGIADIPMTVLMQIKPTSVAASQGFLSIGRSATTDAQRVVGASTAALRHKIKDDAGGNTTTTGTITINTNAHIVTMVDSGTVLNFRQDGANTISTNPYVTNDYGTSTFDRAWLGAECLNTPINYSACNIGRVLVYDRPLLKDVLHYLEYGLATPAGIVVAGA